MKQFLFITTLLFTFSSLFAQPGTNEDPYVAPSNKDRFVLEITHDNWSHDLGDEMEIKWFSRGFNVYYMHDIALGDGKFSVAPGIGFGSSSIFHNAYLTDSVTGGTTFTFFDENADGQLVDPNGRQVKKNKLATTYLDIPLELRFRTEPSERWESFKIAIGFKLGIKVDAHTKTKTEFGEGTKIYKEKNFSDVSVFRAGPTFRIGYGSVNLVGYYSLTQLFKTNAGPEITPFSVGLQINGL